MRKRILTFVAFILLLSICKAGVVSREKASIVAINWAKLNGQNHLSISSIDSVRTTMNSNLYLVSYNPQGYAIVSMHDFTRPILSWSFKSSMLVNEIPEVYQVILDEYNNQIAELLKIEFKGEEIDLQQWNTLTNNVEEEDLYENQRIALNLTARWKQTTPYNNQCTYGGVYYPVGCGQTALGQIMHYWSYPLVGSGYNSYSNTSPSFPLQANFGLTRYNWYNMPNSITTNSPQVEIDAISQLLFHCGVASNAQYATDGTSSSTSDSRNALVTYFRYNPAAEVKNKTFLVSWNTWHGWITGEINGNRPVFYRGDDITGNSHHAYVVYGYQYVGEEPAYLINIGWGLPSDTYWFMTGTTSGEYSSYMYRYNQAAIINIAPLNTQQTLYVESSNPSSGVVITGTGTDLMGNSAGGTTPYERYYNSGASITLTAPQISSNKRFVKWTKNDVDYSTSLSINAPLPTNMHLGSAYYKAVYGTPTLNISPTSLSFGDILINTYSGPQTYTLSGSNLIGNVTVTAPSRYQVSLSSSSGYGSSLTVTPTNGNVNTTIYVRFNPNATGAVTGNVTNTSNGATSRNVAVSGTGVEPSISVSLSSLSFGNVNTNTYSSPQSYSLTGSNLTSNVTVTAPTRYQVSLSSGSGYGSSLNITPSGGSVNRTIYVRFNPNTTGTVTGNVTNASSGATTRNVSVTGTGVNPTPDVDVSPSTLSFGNQIINTSAILSYELTGSYLTANVSVTAPAGYTVSTSQNGTFSPTLTVTQSGGEVDQTIWVKFTPTQSIGYTGNVSNASSGASTANVSVSGTGINQGPIIYTSINSLSFGNQIINTSSIQSYQLTGSYLTSNVTVTAPTGYTVSASQSGTYSSTITVTQSGGNVNQTVWVKFTPTQTITYTGNVSNASSGASTANVAVTGTGIDQGSLPMPLHIEYVDNQIIRLNWDEVAGSDFYRVYRSFTNNPDDWVQIDEVYGLSYLESLTTNQAFYFVTAVNITIPSDFILVEGGTFNNGTSNVTLSPYYIDKYEITQSDYQLVMGTNPSGFGGYPFRPVEQVTWFNAIEYCNRLSILEGFTPCYSYGSYGTNPNNWPTGWNTNSYNHTNVSCNWNAMGYRLPTEMEWLYAAKGGSLSQGYIYSGSNTIANVAWYTNNSGNRTHDVGTKLPNELGIYDMTGNVEEWCWDIWASSYPAGSQTNPTGPTSGSWRVWRGGSWFNSHYGCEISSRQPSSPTYIVNWQGFRVCLAFP